MGHVFVFQRADSNFLMRVQSEDLQIPWLDRPFFDGSDFFVGEMAGLLMD